MNVKFLTEVRNQNITNAVYLENILTDNHIQKRHTEWLNENDAAIFWKQILQLKIRKSLRKHISEPLLFPLSAILVLLQEEKNISLEVDKIVNIWYNH